ncbi:ribosome small subunit-dependent GTPase A [Desulfovibrio inopinatus]|uniref:ribosome small subunit-dependent GTPase A n=1 Tax=Desulfovibrio inopinatus TaxID=102109 RepID=UPI000410850A|nr:ribosome small subunit-dependent GTPase A [Desulfovibrio inopinatus]
MTNHIEFPTNTSDYLPHLQSLGWSDYFDRQLAAINAKQSRVVRVVSVRRNLFLVTDGHNEWLCSPAGKLLHAPDRDYPVTGDWVLVDDTQVTSVIPRKTLLSRGEAGSRFNRTTSARREQAIAANIDTVFIVCGLDRDFNVRRLERYMTLVHNCGVSPVVVLTKSDLHEDPDSFWLDVENIAFGVPVVLTSMLDGRGKNELERYLRQGQTVAMIGSSGAGKSTLANMLYGKDIQSTSEVSDSVGKGRHTTTVRELIRMPQGGMLMDNPGIREIAFYESGHGVESAFADIQDLASMCRFADCSHQQELGCAVLHAVETGELSSSRLESYHKMKREMQYLVERSTKSADRIEKERWKGITRQIRTINKRRKR